MMNPSSVNATPPASALQRLIQRATATAAPLERCDLCSETLPPRHRHMLEVASREIRCVCQACSILFDNKATSSGKRQLIPDRHLYLEDAQMSDAQWERLGIPVGMAFLFYSASAGQVVAYYPSPVGPTEAQVAPAGWAELVASNPVLQSLEPNVEAFLINRARGARQYFVMPIDECYSLIGVIRLHWQGLSGGQEVWQKVEQFFKALRDRSRLVGS